MALVRAVLDESSGEFMQRIVRPAVPTNYIQHLGTHDVLRRGIRALAAHLDRILLRHPTHKILAGERINGDEGGWRGQLGGDTCPLPSTRETQAMSGARSSSTPTQSTRQRLLFALDTSAPVTYQARRTSQSHYLSQQSDEREQIEKCIYSLIEGDPGEHARLLVVSRQCGDRSESLKVGGILSHERKSNTAAM